METVLALVRSLLRAGKLGEARGPLTQLAQQQGTTAEVIALLARFDRLRRAPREAAARLRAGLQRYPRCGELWLEAGLLELTLGHAEAAAEAMERALAFEHSIAAADIAPAVGIVASRRIGERRWAEAGVLLERSVQLEPNKASVWNLRAIQRANLGDLAEAERSAQRAQQLDPGDTHPSTNRCLYALYRDDLAPSEVLAIHRDWERRHGSPQGQAPLPPPQSARQPGRLRIGYVSNDFAAHSVSMFLEPVLARHDRARVEVFCYATVPRPDEVTRRLQACAEHWRDILPLTDEQAARQIREDDIDLLIDLGGYTAHARLGIFLHRPARRAATWLGYPATTGLSAVDCRIGDATADIPGAEAWHSEELLRLPRTFFIYPGLVDAPDVAELPALRKGHVTFGVPTNLCKVRPDTVRRWAEVLARVPGSRLSLLAPGAETPQAQAWIAAAVAGAGTDPSRIDFHANMAFDDYLRAHGEWDVVLDTWPFNGHTTTCHALWMGTPVVTLAGTMHAGRMGASILHALGLDELAPDTPAQFVDSAARLALDLDRLRTLRATLCERMRASPLMDARQFTGDLEAVFEQAARI
jgi:predicted O-linked N-acetylglucosamine transferase (SPINDLY family)